MKKLLPLTLALYALLALLPSCKYPTEYVTVTVANKFSLSLPPWVKQDDELKPGADLQYSNHYRNFYVIAESINKGDVKRTADEMMHDNLNVVRNVLSSPLVTDSTNFTVNGISGLRAEIFGKMGKKDSEENIYYSEVILEGKNAVYHLSVWTRGEDRKLRYKEDINKILNSFKEL